MSTRLSFLLLIINCVLISQNKSTFIEGKTCVATALNRYLCTNDPEKARAHKWDGGEDDIISFESLDLGESQEISGSEEEIENVKKVLNDMKHYFETEVLVKTEYDSVIGRW